MKKGINALELVFMMFILIVVTLVVIKLFSGVVKKESLPNIEDFKYAYRYQQEKSKCENICSEYTGSQCEDLRPAVEFCQKKVSVSIDGNMKTGEKGHFGVVNKQPYCEDGLYCFHLIESCGCGGYILDATTCIDIMRDYYTYSVGLSDETIKHTICEAISPGTCKKDPRTWGAKAFELMEYKPIPALGADAGFGVGSPPVIGADYWWKKAGYADICGETSEGKEEVKKELLLSCSYQSETSSIKCSWSGCSGETEVIVAYSGPTGKGTCNYVGDKSPKGTCTVSNVESGKYNIVLDCDDRTKSISIKV